MKKSWLIYVISADIVEASHHSHVIRWGSMTPLRQFKGVPAGVIRKAEGKQFVSDRCPPIVSLLTMTVFHSLGIITSIWYALSTSFPVKLLKVL